jgi:hypothetical protein
MRKKQVLLPSLDYLVGKQITEKLYQVLGIDNVKALAKMLEVSPSTISTWHQRQACPYEIAVRIHLRKGISLKWLLLDEGSPYPNNNAICESPASYLADKICVDIDLFQLKNGKLVSDGTITLDQCFLTELGINNVFALRHAKATYLIDQQAIEPANGTYLIDFDGFLSLNDMHCSTDGQWGFDFNGTTFSLEETEVRIVGKLIFSIRQT